MNNRYPTPMNDEDRREYDEYESRVRRMFDPNGDREAEKLRFASDRLQHDDDEYDAEDYDDDEFTEEEQAEEARLQQEEDDRIDREYNEMMLWRDYHQEEEDAEAVAWLAAARKARAEADAEVKTDDWSGSVNWNIGTGTASSNAEWFKQNARGTASGFQ
jgi:hypothetical protein